MLLGIDTETSGLWRDDLPPEHGSQPKLVQLGAVLYTAEWDPRARVSLLIQPEGWTIEPEAQRVHGISESQAARYGVRLGSALLTLHDMAKAARTIFGFNVQFDRAVITSSIFAVGAAGQWWARRGRDFRCAMEEATPLCQLPGKFGLKFPSLEEAHAILCPTARTFRSRHDAVSDIEATAEVLRAIDHRKETDHA